jgi:hypothetical protein
MLLKVYGEKRDSNVRLKQYQYSDGTIHWEFRDRLDLPSNPTDEEAKEIIKRWHLIEL